MRDGLTAASTTRARRSCAARVPILERGRGRGAALGAGVAVVVAYVPVVTTRERVDAGARRVGQGVQVDGVAGNLGREVRHEAVVVARRRRVHVRAAAGAEAGRAHSLPSPSNTTG